MIYFDASALIPLVVTESTSQRALTFRNDHIDESSIGDFALGEVAAALSRLVRMHILAEDEADRRWQEVTQWVGQSASSVTTTAADIALATSFVRRPSLGLRLPDAVHLAVCRRLGYRIVTLDQRLLAAAEDLLIEAMTF